jgi:heat shock protein HtpX
LIFGIMLLPVLYILGSRMVRRFHGVVNITPDEKPTLFQMVKKIANSVDVFTPCIGITENLEPNAFTVGYGKRATIVFSSGLLDMLDGAELEAVIAHEIAHIKNHDFHFMALVSVLKVISFFNPIVYLLSSAITREREILADDTGGRLLEKPERLGLALLKIWEAPKEFSQGFLTRFISSLFIISEIGQLKTLFAAHPPLERRLSKNAEKEFWSSVSRDKPKSILACFMIAVMLFSFCYPLFQNNYFGERKRGIFFTTADSKYGVFSYQPYKLVSVQRAVGEGVTYGSQTGPSYLQDTKKISVMMFAQDNENLFPKPSNLNTIITLTLLS